ncbi:MAG: protein kinase [Myxococcota bacterium]
MSQSVLLVVADDARRAELKEALVPWFSVVEARGAQPGMSYLREAAFDAVIASDENRQLALKSMFGMIKKIDPPPATFLLAIERSNLDELRVLAGPETKLFASEARADSIARAVLAKFGRAPATPTRRTYDRRALVDRTKSWDVHLAVASTGETVLLSEPGGRMLDNAELCAEFLRVGALASKLAHPNLAPIIDVGDGDRCFIAYGAPSGLTLGQLRKWLVGADRRLSTALAVNLMGEVLSALEAVHDQKLTHGALDPHAIWLSADGISTVLHVGTGRLMGSTERARSQGTSFPYLAPEQIEEQHTDSRTDLFLAGILLYELLSNDRLFLREDAVKTQDAIRAAEVAPLPDYVPLGIDTFVQKLLAKDPDARPKSAHAALAELGQAMQDKRQRSSRSSSGVFGRIFGGAPKRNDSVPPPPAEGGPRVELAGLVRAALRDS